MMYTFMTIFFRYLGVSRERASPPASQAGFALCTLHWDGPLSSIWTDTPPYRSAHRAAARSQQVLQLQLLLPQAGQDLKLERRGELA